jgi:hypothetical protein
MSTTHEESSATGVEVIDFRLLPPKSPHDIRNEIHFEELGEMLHLFL